MEFKWQDLKTDVIEYTEIERESIDPSQGVCHTHTPDCGSIKKNEKCQCGSLKTTHHSFCTSCHSILPKDLQKDVDWCPEIYQAAIQYLTQ